MAKYKRKKEKKKERQAEKREKKVKKKSSQRKERKATQTLAVVLGEYEITHSRNWRRLKVDFIR